MWLAAQEGVFPQELAPDLGLILDAMPDGVYGVDATGRTVLVNRAAAAMLGYQPQELIGTVPHDVMHHSRADGTPLPREACPLAIAAAEGRACTAERDTFWRRDGTSFPVEYESRPMLREGRMVGFLVTFRDISARLKSEERLRELLREQFAKARAEFQYAQLRDVLAQTPAVICVTRGPRHVIETANEQFRELVGGREVIGLTIREAFPEADHRLLALMDLAFETGQAAHGTESPIAVTGPSGLAEERYYDFVYQPLRDETGYVYGLMTHAVDVTREVLARHQLEARSLELERINTRLRLAAEAGRLGAWEWELKTGRLIWSPELERIHGLEPGTFAGTVDASQSGIHPDDRHRVLAEISDAVARRLPHRLEYRIVLPDGAVRWVEARGQMFLDVAGEPDRLVGICMDVTERKHAEMVLQQRAEELSHMTAQLARTNAELDAFAYAASHDLRAPLRGIANLAQWIEEDLTASGDLGSDTREMLELMRTRMHRMEALIEGILQYSRAGRVQERPVTVDTRRLVSDLVDLLGVPEHVTVEVDESLPELESPLPPLQQVFMNLMGNALKYNDTPHPVIRVTARDADAFVEFSVADNGPGIPPAYHERIWGIFQTLEARDKVEGTGIGLSLVKKLVEAQGGRAWVESTPGQGATFSFQWPKRARRAAADIEE